MKLNGVFRPDFVRRKKHKGEPAKPKEYTAEEEKMFGNKAFSQSKYTKAIHHFTNAIEKSPAVPLYYSNRAAAYYHRVSSLL